MTYDGFTADVGNGTDTPTDIFDGVPQPIKLYSDGHDESTGKISK